MSSGVGMVGRELIRRPGGFVVPTGILLLLALLLLYPSAILDGVLADSTAALRNAPADLIVYTRAANGVMGRSRIDADTRESVAEVPGVDGVASFDVLVLTGQVAGDDQPYGFCLLASERPFGPIEPGPGEAVADISLRDRAGVREGSEVLVGPFRVPVTVVGFARGINLAFAGGLVVDRSTLLAALGQSEEAASADAAASAEVTQALLVDLAADADDREAMASRIDAATDQVTQTLTMDQAVRALPGVEQQQTTFGYIRGVTLAVALVVVGLFLTFVSLERAPLYAVLKAVGTSSRQLFLGLVVQVLAITGVAVAAAALVTWGLTQIPFELPATLHPTRVLETLVALAVTAVVGSCLSLRRVLRIDPADAIG